MTTPLLVSTAQRADDLALLREIAQLFGLPKAPDEEPIHSRPLSSQPALNMSAGHTIGSFYGEFPNCLQIEFRDGENAHTFFAVTPYAEVIDNFLKPIYARRLDYVRDWHEALGLARYIYSD